MSFSGLDPPSLHLQWCTTQSGSVDAVKALGSGLKVWGPGFGARGARRSYWEEGRALRPWRCGGGERRAKHGRLRAFSAKHGRFPRNTGAFREARALYARESVFLETRALSHAHDLARGGLQLTGAARSAETLSTVQRPPSS